MNSTIVGSIKLHLLEALTAKYQSKDINEGLIKALKDKYSPPGISGTFPLFKELLDTCVAQFSHPAPSLSKVIVLFACIDAAGYKFPDSIQVMLLLAKLPPSMDVVVQMIAQAKDASGKVKTPTVDKIQKAVILSWDQCHLKDTSKATQANKISAVKCKRDYPKFEQQ